MSQDNDSITEVAEQYAGDPLKESTSETSENGNRDRDHDHDDCLLCPICKDLVMIPRLYGCGHNVCEECMINADKAVEDDLTHTVPIYKCPICRNETLHKWYDRPINNALIDVLCKISQEYSLKNDSHEKQKISEIPSAIIPKNVNLAYSSKHIREYRTETLYNQIVPILYRAALDGKAYITITSSTNEIGLVADSLAKKLIARNGIYRFIAGHRECQIELVPSDRSYRCDFENEHYNPDIPIITNDSSSSENTSQSPDLLQNDDRAQSGEIIVLPIDDNDGAPDRQSRELSSFLVNHILRNMARPREQSST